MYRLVRADDRRTRRRVIAALGGLGFAGLGLLSGCGPVLSSPAQQPGRLPRIGVLSPDAAGPSPLLDGLVDALRTLGHVDGRTVTLVYRYADGRSDRLHELARELVRIPVELIIAPTMRAAEAAKLATATIPIVAVGMTSDPVTKKLAGRLDRPGGNLTGTVVFLGDHGAKQVELLKAVIPTLSRLAVLWNPEHRGRLGVPGVNDHLGEFGPALRAAGVQLRSYEVRAASQLGTALNAAASASVDGMLVWGDSLLLAYRAAIVEFAAHHRLPTLYDLRDFADAGGLMAYGESMRATYRGAADHVDKILRGADPAELQIVRPSWTQLVVNLKTAQALGLTIPGSVLDRATEVIQ